MEIRTCPSCLTRFVVVPRLTKSRPKTYCSVKCRRAAEGERRRERQRKAHEEYLKTLPAPMREWLESIPTGEQMCERAGLVSANEFLDELIASHEFPDELLGDDERKR